MTLRRSGIGAAPPRLIWSAKHLACLLALISAMLVITGGYFTLKHGHPHEDAYILYVYSEQLADTGVINYFDGGPPAEGATDFLWMVMLATLYLLGIPTAVGALILNALGVAATTAMLVFVARSRGAHLASVVPMAVLAPLSATALASIAGFSTGMYSALALGLFVLGWTADRQRILLVPPLGLIVALFRPDGAILGAFAAIVGLIYAKGRRTAYRRMLLGTALLGLAYFAWRWTYFDALLPLPLLVKSSADTALPGLSPSIDWLRSSLLLIGFAAFALIDSFKLRSRPVANALPFALLGLALLFATQSQNVAARFSAPAMAIVLLAVSVGSAHWCRSGYSPAARNRRGVLVGAALTVQAILLVPSALGIVRYLTNDDYINFFPYHFAASVTPETVSVISEAGRYAYWVPGEKYDIVGLNTAETALSGASVEYIGSLSPDVVFGWASPLLSGYSCPSSQDFCRVTHPELQQAVDVEMVADSLRSEDRVNAATGAVVQFLLESPEEYVLYLVRYGSGFPHLYGIRVGGTVDEDRFVAALGESFSEGGRLSYLDMLQR
jgi:hypothetical protein